jgi:hypothetical protein
MKGKERRREKKTHLPHINSNLTTLPNYQRSILFNSPFSEDSEDINFLSFLRRNTVRSDSAKSLGSFMSNHIIFLLIPEDMEERWD